MTTTNVARALVFGVLFTAALTTDTLAQQATGAATDQATGQPTAQATGRPEFGLRLGGGLAQLRGEEDVFGDDATDWKTGFTAGAFVRFPLTERFSVQPELLFKQEGGSISESFVEDGQDVRVDMGLNVSYLEIPVLLAYEVPLQSRLRPSVYAGPYVGYAVQRSVDFELAGADDGGFDLSIDAKDVFETLNYGALVGVDLGFPVAGRRATAGLRYDLGLANVFTGGADLFEDGDVAVAQPEARTSSFSAVVSFTF